MERHHHHRNFYKEKIDWGGSLTVSEVQSTIIMTESMAVGVQADMVPELRVLHLAGNRKSTGSHTEGNFNKKDLKAHPHSDTPPQTIPHCLAVLFSLGTNFLHTAVVTHWPFRARMPVFDLPPISTRI